MESKQRNPFPFSFDNKRYHTLYYHNRAVFGGRVYKASVDAGFSCPNIDGTRGTGGCIFCDGGSRYFSPDGTLSVTEQLAREKERILKKDPTAKFLAYFQSHSNTYAPAERIEALCREAVSFGACAISLATRADCINEEKALMLALLPVPVTVELGLQTADNEIAKAINRCHTYEEFLSGYSLLKKHNIRVCVHIINGLPGDTCEGMLNTARLLGRLRPDGVKIHLLHVIRGTELHRIYERGEYTPLSREEYIDTVVRQLELLPPETVIERLTGDGDKKTLIAPLWSADKIAVLGGIDRRQRELDSWQGKHFSD